MPHKGKKGHRRRVIKVEGKKSSLSHKIKLESGGNSETTGENFSLPKKKFKVTKKAKTIPSPKNESIISKKTLVKEEIDDARFRRKHGRIIIRNLPFQVTEEKLREYLENYGLIEEINILHRPDGKLVGCGFVQFATRKSAEKAISECNAKPFLGRPIIFDWAVPKEVFKTNFKPPVCSTKVVKKTKPSKVNKVEEKRMEEDEMEEVNEETENNSSEGTDLNEDMVRDQKECSPRKNMPDKQKPFHRTARSGDDNGCTVFLKNVSFQSTNEELKDFMESFGPVQYALICKDPLTEHSRGTAFVKFKKKESAEKCLSAGSDELTLDGSVLSAMPALSREEAKKKVDEEKEKSPKDVRNLYLLKEGVIIAGSKAANGVSVSDMTKRVKLDQWKNQILKNLKMFVSRYRLVIHNLPSNYTDRQLRKLCMENAGPEAVIKEAKVMQDLKKIDSTGLGQSKGYGFVTFTKHENALSALRNINNNPDIFRPDKRPIVAFSIENKAIINAKKKRLLKSQAMNPLFQERNKNKSLGDSSLKEQGNGKKISSSCPKEKSSEEVIPSFGGLASNPGVNKIRLRNKYPNQVKIHTDNVKKDRHKRKAMQQQTKIRTVSDGRSQASQQKKLKRKSNMEDAAFVNLVKKYKNKLTSAPQKWYENSGD